MPTIVTQEVTRFEGFLNDLNQNLDQNVMMSRDSSGRVCTSYEQRLPWSVIQRIAGFYGLDVYEILDGSSHHKDGGFWRVIGVSTYDAENSHQAILIEDSDSPHTANGFKLYFKCRFEG
jgi:hypothetical protein